MEIFTVGHYNHSEKDFLKLLNFAGIELLVDIRAFPGSRKFPWFTKERMETWLPEEEIEYLHIEQLGGRRPISQLVSPSLNDGWKNQSFHNYADYTLSNCFQKGMRELMSLAVKKRTAICCSERHPARCHRLLISNWLAAREWKVSHIVPARSEIEEIIPHELGRWGAMPIIEEDKTIVYPCLNE